MLLPAAFRSLHEIDLYCQDWIRYIASGRHIKKNHSLLTHEMMRDCGYRPLVSEYYKPRGNRLEDTI